jgi:DNA primase
MGAVDEIKERLDIVEVVSSYLRLEKSGRNFKANCPFHSERTPSFYVFPESQRWHCFGACSEGGDVFSFVMKQEGWDFRTTLEALAQRAGVELRPRTPAQIREQEESRRLRSALAEAEQVYHQLLLHAPEAEAARAYISQRGLTEETVNTFRLGYSLPGWDNLRTHLLGQGFTLEDLISAGLEIKKEDGSTYDRFRDRLMIPIRDVRDRVIGFGARTLERDGVPKYINSPQTPIFDKSRTLYGLALARRAIRDADQVVIVEGYMDVMQAHQAGFRNVVAQMGTALTEQQVRLLQRYTRRFVLALDPDAAGVQATLRGLEVARETLDREGEPIFNPRGLVGYEGRLGAEIRILSLPSGNDPDDVIRTDPQLWADLVEAALPVVEFMFYRLLDQSDLDDAKDRARIVQQMLPLLRDVADPVERETYAQKIARALHIQEKTLLARLHRSERRAAQPQIEQAAVRVVRSGVSTTADLEAFCLAGLIRCPWLLDRVNQVFQDMSLSPLRPDDFNDPANRMIFEVWGDMSGQESRSDEDLWRAVPAALTEQLESILASSAMGTEEQWAREVVRGALKMRKRNLKQTGADLHQLMEEADSAEVRERVWKNARKLQQVEQALGRRWDDIEWPADEVVGDTR